MGLEKTGRIARVLDRPAQSRRRLRRRARHVLRAAAGARRLSGRPTAGRPGNGSCSSTRTPAPPISRWTRAIRASSSPATWPIDIKTWGRKSGGPGGGVFVSRDGGTTWKRSTGTACRTRRSARSPSRSPQSDPQRVYALIETGDRGSLWRSDDGGENWKLVNHSRLLNERPHYYTRMLVMPDNANEVYFPSNGMGVDATTAARRPSRSAGAATTTTCGPIRRTRGRMMIGNDGGVMISTTRGPAVELHAPADRPDVPRHDRQPDSLLRLRADAGRRLGARPEQQPGAARHPPGAVDLDRRLRDRLGDARPGRPERRLGRLLRRASSSASTRGRA